MLKPVKRSIHDDTELLGFVHFPQDAALLVGANVKEYEITLPYVGTIEQAWKAAETISNYWTDWIKNRVGGEPRAPLPHVRQSGDEYTLTQVFYLLSRDIPMGRNIQEAIEDPILFYPRTRKRKLYYKGKTPVNKLKEIYPVDYARRSTVERKFGALLLSTAATVIETEDGRFTIELIYWKLDPVQLPRDIKHEVDEHENFDLWGEWKVEQQGRAVGATNLTLDVDEGSGRGME